MRHRLIIDRSVFIGCHVRGVVMIRRLARCLPSIFGRMLAWPLRWIKLVIRPSFANHCTLTTVVGAWWLIRSCWNARGLRYRRHPGSGSRPTCSFQGLSSLQRLIAVAGIALSDDLLLAGPEITTILRPLRLNVKVELVGCLDPKYVLQSVSCHIFSYFEIIT